MLKRIVNFTSAGGRGLILVALVSFLAGLMGVFVGFRVQDLGFGKAYAEQGQGDRGMGGQGDKETRGQGEES